MFDPQISVLLIDDDEALRDLLREFFQQNRIELSVLHQATTLQTRLQRERPSIIVLDVMLPGIDGLTALKQLRMSGDNIPVILLTAKAEGVDRVVGLELGADDYLGKPFMPQELLARIKAVLRRHMFPAGKGRPNQPSPIRFGDYILDFNARTLRRGDELIKLTTGEFALLEIFARNPLQALSRSEILILLHGYEARFTERGIDVPVWRLRRLIEKNPADPRFIQTIRGIGYMFVPSDSIDEADRS
ncbi:response regulator [Burkholderia ubonensis]|uniref:response regulator n=1 Tax=Burkholderia ubonensis TaxID=101571 RepID=UPI0009B3B3D4|nr:response regulator [Burkholderia ubonensis]